MTVIISSLHTNETTFDFFPLRTGRREDDDGDGEMVDAVEEEGEGDEDDNSEEGDLVTESGLAQSEEGKQPVFHHDIYDRLVNLMSRQGAYSIFLPTLLL